MKRLIAVLVSLGLFGAVAFAADRVVLMNSGGAIVISDTLSMYDAAGDLVQGTGSDTAARLAIGTAGKFPKVNAGGTALEYSTVTETSGALAGVTTLTATGAINGAATVTSHVNASTTLTAAQMKGTMHLNGSTAGVYLQLPAATVGMNACFYNHLNGSIVIDPNGTDTIHLNGSTQGAGFRMISDGVSGTTACLIALANNAWGVISKIGTWVVGGN